MVVLETLQRWLTQSETRNQVYEVTRPIDLYDSSAAQALSTQAQVGRRLQVQSRDASALAISTAIPVVLCEDDYPGWLALESLGSIQPSASVYDPPCPTLTDIRARIPQAIAFAQAAMHQPNVYLWGGTLGPHYDCSGLVQHAFATQGIWLPRDAYQQEAFVQPIENPGDRPEALTDVIQPGDLLFFGTPLKATHVALYLGNGTYIHSSGKDQGRNGIGLDSITDLTETVSRNYYAQVRGAGRIVRSYLAKSNVSSTAKN